ncbi:hypothetical protein [Pseudarthrobacter sp. Y6]|uniref:hypothetical protein n=1 Tax=Pseudarthrobacter sp. Y6 TaxID=3418422 RepID=UPI003CEFFD62
MNQPAPTQQTSATFPGKARVIAFSVDPHVTLDPFQVPGYSEDLSCREREDILDEAEWALEDQAEPEDSASGETPRLKPALSQTHR